MAVYKLKNIRMVPCYYLASTGATAAHDNTKDELTVDEHSNPVSTWKQVTQGDFAFTDAAEYAGLTEEQAARAVYSPFPNFFAEQESFGAVREVVNNDTPLQSGITSTDDSEDVDVSLGHAESGNETRKGRKRS